MTVNNFMIIVYIYIYMDISKYSNNLFNIIFYLFNGLTVFA